jgi:DNA-binding MarR family transcriptional regulator
MTNALEAMDLTAAQGHIMAYLVHAKEPPCPRDVEAAFQLSHPTVSGLLSRLEQKGFLELRADPNDRRCKRIHVLEKGNLCHQTMHDAIQTSEQKMLTGFTPEEQAQFAAFLQRAIHNMGSSPCHHPQSKEDKP